MTFPNTGSAEPVRLPVSMTTANEFMQLMALRERIDARLDVLIAVLSPALKHLPRSGLTQAAPGVMLFKGRGGRDA